MNTEHFRKLLLDRRQEIESTLASLEIGSAAPGQPEVGDYTDAATATQSASDSLERATVLSQTLKDVQDALRRIEDGSYGKCTLCGREIEEARLESVPWTQYCLADQRKLEGNIGQSSTL